MVRYTRIRCPKLPELKNLKKSHWVDPRVSLYLHEPLRAPQGYKSGGGDVLILGFWPKTISNHIFMHKKVTMTLWFV